MPNIIRGHVKYPERPKPAPVAPAGSRSLNFYFEPWSEAEDAVVTGFYEELGPTKIGQKLGRSAGAVTQRYIKLRGRQVT